MWKTMITMGIVLLRTLTVSSQTPKIWTLEDCINYAEEHNINVHKQSFATEKERLALQKEKWSFVPSISASSGYTASIGRVLDPTTYQFEQTNLTSNSSSSVEGSVTLFAGGKKMKTFERAKLSLKASFLKEKSNKYNLKLNVITAFMDVLCAREQISIARKSAELIKEQLVRSQNLLDAGSITEADVLQLQSQLFAAENDLSAAQQSEKIAKLSLCDLLEIEDYETFSVAEPSYLSGCNSTIDVNASIINHPDYQTSVINKSLAESDYKIAKSVLYPTISLSVGYSSSWSDARKKTIQNPNGTIRYEAYSFFEQYVDNAGAYVSVGLKIPILTGLAARNSLRRAELAVREAELVTIEYYKKLRKQIIQAQIDCDSARDQYIRSIAEARYSEEAQYQITDKYNLGATDYLSWKTALIESVRSSYYLVDKKCTYILKCEILKMYEP